MRISEGTRAFVTGASRGIGRSLAELLSSRGATLGLAARSSAELAQLAERLPATGYALECDVASSESVQHAIDEFAALAGGLDLLVANAGVTHYAPFRDQPLADAERMTGINWLGTVYTVHAGLPRLLEQGSGHIVIVSSGAALRSFPSAAVYGATKAAQRMFGEALRHELAGTGVSLTIVYPGEIATSLHDHEKDTMPAWYRGGADAAAPDKLAARILEAVEADRRALHYPPVLRLLGTMHNVAPRASDALLRRLRGATAAPRRD
jgi:short-subunit dehydrogenase